MPELLGTILGLAAAVALLWALDWAARDLVRSIDQREEPPC